MAIRRSVSLTFLVLAASPLSLVGCGGGGDSTAAGGQDLSGNPAAPPAASAAKSGGATASNPPAATATATSSKTLFSCTDDSNSGSQGLVTLSPDLGLAWQILGQPNTTRVLSVDGSAGNYTIVTAGGDVLDLQMSPGRLGIGPGLFVECSAAPTIDQASLDALVQQTKASEAKEQPFATCTTQSNDEPTTYTVRPALAGAGAIIESGGRGTNTDEAIAIWAVDVTDGGDTVTYTGAGGLTGEHDDGTSFSSLTTQGAAGSALISLDGMQFAPSGCTVTGADYAKSLIHPSGT